MKITLNHQAVLEYLTPEVFYQLAEELTFDNPKYIEAQKFGRWTGKIPRSIELFEPNTDVEPGNFSLICPRGAIDAYVASGLFDEIVDQRHVHPVKIETSITLRDYQERAITAAIEAGGGVIEMPTGAGKTVSLIELAARLGQRCLILVKSKDLANQWLDEIHKWTGCYPGLIGGGKWQEGDEFTVGLIPTLVKHEGSLDYGLVVVDEAHNTPANQAFAVVNRQAARYRIGLTATPQRRDGLERMIFAALGPIVAQVDQSELAGAVLPVKVYTQKHRFIGSPASWFAFISILENDAVRNRVLIEKTCEFAEYTGTAVLTASIAHAEHLAAMLEQQGQSAVVLHGQLKKAERVERMQTAESARIIIGTVHLLGEGINWPHIGAVVFAAPVSAEVDRDNPAATRLIQSIGRARRPFPGKQSARVFDLIDECGFGIAAFKKRRKIYEQQNFTVFDPLTTTNDK